jgi:hypothetical protein
VHYNALFGDGKNKDKALNAEFAETLRKDLREIGEDEPIREHNVWAAPRKRAGWPLRESRNPRTQISAKPFICITITHRSL